MGDFYKIFNEETGFSKEVFLLKTAKQLIKEENAKCEKWFVWSNGERRLTCAIDKKGQSHPLSYNKK